jgi:hypothetical protein
VEYLLTIGHFTNDCKVPLHSRGVRVGMTWGNNRARVQPRMRPGGLSKAVGETMMKPTVFAPRPLAEGLRQTLLYEMGQLGMRAPPAA